MRRVVVLCARKGVLAWSAALRFSGGPLLARVLVHAEVICVIVATVIPVRHGDVRPIEVPNPHFSAEIERRFFDADSTDADASIDRGARRRSKIVEKNIAFATCLPTDVDASL